MEQAELDRALEKLDSLMNRYASQDQQPMTVSDAKRLQDVVDLLNTPE